MEEEKVPFLGIRQEQTKEYCMNSIEDVQSQSDTDKNEHLNIIVHEIIDNLDIVDDRKQDRGEKENERSDYFESIITTDTQSGHKNEAEIVEDNNATLIETYEPSNSHSQNATNKNSESNQEIRLSDLEEQDIELLEQVETHETNVAETIEDDNSKVHIDESAYNIETSYETEIKPEKEDLTDEKNRKTSQICQALKDKNMNKTSVFENHGLQFVMFIGNNF